MLEKTILSNLILNEDYCRKVYPYLKSDYFDDTALRKVFETASEYMEKYKEPPSIEALKIAIDHRKDLTEDTYQTVHQTVDELQKVCKHAHAQLEPKNQNRWACLIQSATQTQ